MPSTGDFISVGQTVTDSLAVSQGAPQGQRRGRKKAKILIMLSNLTIMPLVISETDTFILRGNVAAPTAASYLGGSLDDIPVALNVLSTGKAALV